MADPNGTRNPVTTHPLSSNSATASRGSLARRVFIQQDVLQLCLDWPGILLQETLEGEVLQMFLAVQCSTWMPLVLYQEGNWGNPWQSRAGHIRPGHHWEPSLGSPDALISMCMKVRLEVWYSLLTGAGCRAPCDLGSCHNHTWRRAVRREIGSLRCFHFSAWYTIFWMTAGGSAIVAWGGLAESWIPHNFGFLLKAAIWEVILEKMKRVYIYLYL